MKTMKTVLIHSGIWLFYIFFESSLLLIIDDFALNYWETGLNFILYICLFYTSSLVTFPKLYLGKKYVLLATSIVFQIGVLIALRYLVTLYVVPQLDEALLHPFTNFRIFLAHTIWRGTYFTILSVGYFFAIHAIEVERQRRILIEARLRHESELQKVERSLMKAEIANLKNQINPHFLYNSLNLFYSKIYSYSESTARGVLLLSNMMRYATKEDDYNGKVLLEKEIEHIHNYISINQMRFDNKLNVDLQISGSTNLRMITPLLLITFVENCFKHGDLLDPDHPLLIRIEISDEQLRYYSHNKKRGGSRIKSTGVGLANVKQRLDLEYPDYYSLDLKDESLFYSCNLVLKL
jgi:sensor histidine kinase YesM